MSKINREEQRIKKFMNLYISVNEMMCVLGAKGDISTRSDVVTTVMDALYEMDDGVYEARRVFSSAEIKASMFAEWMDKHF